VSRFILTDIELDRPDILNTCAAADGVQRVADRHRITRIAADAAVGRLMSRFKLGDPFTRRGGRVRRLIEHGLELVDRVNVAAAALALLDPPDFGDLL